MFKKISFVVLFLQLFFNNAAFAQMHPDSSGSSEEEAIKQAIINETRSWEQRDYKGMSDAWLQEEYVSLMYSSPYTYRENIGWDTLNSRMKEGIEKYKDPLKIDFQWSDWNIRVFNDCAFVSYIQTNKMRGENPYESREIRFLEKKNGLWKFVYSNTILKSIYQEFDAKGAEYRLNDAGYILLEQNKFEEAIEVFKLNVELYPESSNVYDSLGEGYMKKGENDLAIENYLISLKLDPNNKNAEEMINKIRVK